MLWFFEIRHHDLLESIAKIAHFYILILPGGGGGGHFEEKIQKNHFFKGCGEKTAIINIKASALKLLANFGLILDDNIKLKRDTSLQENQAELNFSCNLGKNSRLFFNFLA